MSLYDGVLDDQKSNTSSSWNSGIDLLKSQLKTKRLTNTEREKRQSAVPAPVIDFASRKRFRKLYDGPEISFNSLTGKMEIVPPKCSPVIPAGTPSPSIKRVASIPSFVDSPVRHAPYSPNEYDPLRPNDYEEIKERRRKEAERKRQEPMPVAPAEPGNVATCSIDAEPTPLQPVGPSVVSKIMAKMGYKQGLGLGKSNQGMSHALSVEKTSRRCGKIVGDPSLAVPVPAQALVETTALDLFKNPSKVVLLRNMVTHGQVDNELEGETAEECTKYGKVKKVLIFEIPDAPDEEAVRIFVEFEKIEAATKAIVDLNGRFFGGRSVKACFYNLDKFRQYVLGDDV